MEGLRSFAIWLFLFGIVGNLCQQQNPETSNNPEVLDGKYTSTDKVLIKVDQQNEGRTSEKRVVRYVPQHEGTHVHPSGPEMTHQRLLAQAQRQRNANNAGLRQQPEANARPQQQQRGDAAGRSATTERTRYAGGNSGNQAH